MTNAKQAEAVLKALKDFGVHEIVLCAGARNAPFVKAVQNSSDFKVYSFFEERSAAFFALGRILAEEKPVAVLTTSGTAAAELLPATIEADYQRLPLVLVTADRPKRYRGTGAPQTIVQPGIYTHYVEWSCDLDQELPGSVQASGERPIHFNVCFDEPLLEKPV